MATPPLIKVLVVEEDAAARWAVHDALEAAGYLVAEAPAGQPILHQLQESQHEWVVVLDGKAPEGDGLAFLQRIAREPTLVKRHAYILLTERRKTFPLPIVHVFRQLGVRVLQKPVEPAALTTAIKQVAHRLA